MPGPSTCRTDAVVTPPADRVTGPVSAHHPVAEGREPSVADGPRDALPPGPFGTGEVSTSAFSQDGWWARRTRTSGRARSSSPPPGRDRRDRDRFRRDPAFRRQTHDVLLDSPV
ncbi:hypothetical protein CKY47_25065 [Saccharothrix yanglingensis]|uniref:Uncharacterized protein n=1 Tax=Saccharothrix yanglingensis TaxID=659496 RepID=A0ABU0X503_9PSEU|nr:hypothetical protein [Saccharothrix yanglingensis]